MIVIADYYHNQLDYLTLLPRYVGQFDYSRHHLREIC